MPSSFSSNDKDFLFIFIVDRSESMAGQRMDITKKLLTLFLESLPNGCKF